jgi:CubicO group peptidase (beta-lactamase class C family)
MLARALLRIATILLGLAISHALAQSLPTAKPEAVGLSAAKLQRLTDAFQAEVDKGAIPGAVLMVARNGKVGYFKAIGLQDREKQIAMKPDSIFWIASLTKPIATVAAMMLVEEGKIQIDDPVARYLPELKDMQVGVEKVDPSTGKPQLVLEPVRRPMTVQDLLRHTSGFTYPNFGNSLVNLAYTAADVFDPRLTLSEFVTKVSKLPLAYQPGTTWDYGVSTDVLGRIVEVVSGMPFDRFITERITRPLKLSDTAFVVSQANAFRIAQPQNEPATGKRPAFYHDMTVPPKLISGGVGMVSTASDYLRFCQMLLSGGALDGARLLEARTVRYMTVDHLPPDVGFSPAAYFFGASGPTRAQGQGFGLGFAVRNDEGRNARFGNPGKYFWISVTGAAFFVDPQEKLIGIMMVQLPIIQTQHYRSLFENLVYQAVEK